MYLTHSRDGVQYSTDAVYANEPFIPLGDTDAAADAAAQSGTDDWFVEARSLEWQSFARAWNGLITSLRHSDLLTNDESAEVR